MTIKKQQLKVGDKFNFADQPSVIFKVVSVYLAAGFIPSVTGHTLDGKFKTNARQEDVQAVTA